jgi:hypothetical protein
VNQPALELVPVPVPPLRLAYERTSLRDRFTYQQAMSRPVLALCLRNTAQAIQRKDAK